MKKRQKTNSLIFPANRASLAFGIIACLSLIILMTSCTQGSGSGHVGPGIAVDPELDPNLFAVATMSNRIKMDQIPQGEYLLTKINYEVRDGDRWGVAYQPLGQAGVLASEDSPRWRTVTGTDTLACFDEVSFTFPTELISNGERHLPNFNHALPYRADLRHAKWRALQEGNPTLLIERRIFNQSVVLDNVGPYYHNTDRDSAIDTYVRLSESQNRVTILQVNTFGDPNHLTAVRLVYVRR